MAAEVNITVSENLERGLDAIAERSRMLGDAMTRALEPVRDVARQIVPQPGYRGDKKGKKALRDTIVIKVKQYDEVWLGIVEPTAQHRRLVEYGHRIVISRGKRKGEHVGQAKETPFMRPAIEQASGMAEAAFEQAIDQLVRDAWQT